MNLTSLKVAGIRGFNDELTLDFDGKLVIYSGPNGGGKTSIGEAIEWLLYGKTLKRLKGDEISKREYAGSYRNTHYHGSVDPFVEIQIVDTTGTLRTIRRELAVDETSKLTVDGGVASDLRQFGIGAVYDRPLILQHTLQDFVFMRPKTRYEVLSAMLGLEPLVDFRSAVETAKTDFQNNLPEKAIEAQNRSALLVSSFQRNPLLQPVVTSIGQRKLKDARNHLVQTGLGRVPAGTKENEILGALRQAKTAKERAKLDWGRFSLNPIPRPDLHAAITGLASLAAFLESFTIHTAEAVQQVARTSDLPLAYPIRQFYSFGLQLIDAENPERCPLCLQDTLTPERLAEVRKATEVVPEARAPLSAAQESLGSFRGALSRQWQHATKLIPSLPNEEEINIVNQLAAGSVEARESYSFSCEGISKAAGELQASKSGLEDALRATEDALTEDRAPNDKAPSLGTAFEKYAEIIRELPGVSNGYAASYAALDPAIKGRLASEEDVRFLGTLIDGLERWSDVMVSCEVSRIVEELQELVRQCRQFIELKQKQILGLRDKEIKTWYQLLGGSAEVGYSGMIPGTDNLDLRAQTFAKGMMAAPNLSGSQLNCIGLAVYLATCCRTGSPFKMVLFDDPIQSMDDEHTEAFKKQVVSKLLNSGFQVILLSHMDNFVDDVERLYRQHAPLYYKLERYTESGPNVVWKGPEIKKLLYEVKKNKDAQNDGYRKEAVQDLRQFVERFVKDIFTAETGQSVSKRFEDKAWNELRLILRQCQKFDSGDEAILEDTHTFTSRHLHTDETLPHKVPSSHQVNPHYEAMKQLFDKYCASLLLSA
jgi:hypothetical protein